MSAKPGTMPACTTPRWRRCRGCCGPVICWWSTTPPRCPRPWPGTTSAGRPLSWQILLALRRRGVRWAALTHAAGLSATGDGAIDAALPLPERYDIPLATVAAVSETRRRGGRVVAVGTTVVRALEGAAAAHGGVLCAGAGVTALRIGPGHRPLIVDGVLSGTHDLPSSHAALLAAFTGPALLGRAVSRAEALAYTTHELGDAMLVLPGAQTELGHKSFFCGDSQDAVNYQHVADALSQTAAAAVHPCPGAGRAQLGGAHV